MPRPIPILVALAATLWLAAPVAGATVPAAGGERADLEPAAVPGEVVIGMRGGGERIVRLEPGERRRDAIERLSRDPGVAYAGRHWIARIAVDPLDGGRSGHPGGWRDDQWNFLGPPGGVRAETAWLRLAAAGRPGGEGVVVAVVDTGVAYTGELAGFARSPGFTDETSFAPGRDIVSGNAWPLDRNGHGTHIAGTIAEQVTLAEPVEGERDYLAGLAYGATVMPVRVLRANGSGSVLDVNAGIRWAARHGADVINLSLELSGQVRRCGQVRSLCRAIRFARERGALVVAAAGNTVGVQRRVRFPAAAPGVLAVGASTEGGCLASYSQHGGRLDLLAPGGGRPWGRTALGRCAGDRHGIRQVTFSCFGTSTYCSPVDFAIRPAQGTSMAAAHASAAAALLRASGAAGADPGPARLRNRLACSARPLGRPRFHGSGLLDVARATLPISPPRCGS